MVSYWNIFTNVSCFYFQIDGNGNCMFSAIKRALEVHTADNHDHPYYPTRYFHGQVVVSLVQN